MNICQVLSPSEFSRISYCETNQKAWKILQTTYELIKLVKSTKIQMLASQFKGIKMLEKKYFNEFYTKISDLCNSMINLWKKIYDAKRIKKILRFIWKIYDKGYQYWGSENKNLNNMKIEELVGSLQTYEFSLPRLKKTKSIAFKTAKKKKNQIIHLMRILMMRMD